MIFEYSDGRQKVLAPQEAAAALRLHSDAAAQEIFARRANETKKLQQSQRNRANASAPRKHRQANAEQLRQFRAEYVERHGSPRGWRKAAATRFGFESPGAIGDKVKASKRR